MHIILDKNNYLQNIQTKIIKNDKLRSELGMINAITFLQLININKCYRESIYKSCLKYHCHWLTFSHAS